MKMKGAPFIFKDEDDRGPAGPHLSSNASFKKAPFKGPLQNKVDQRAPFIIIDISPQNLFRPPSKEGGPKSPLPLKPPSGPLQVPFGPLPWKGPKALRAPFLLQAQRAPFL